MMAWRAPVGGAFVRFLPLPTLARTATRSSATSVNLTQIIAHRARARAHGRRHGLPARARSSARRCGRSRTTVRSPPRSACPVRRVEAAAWFGSGLVCGAAGLLLADLFTSLDYSALDVPRHLVARGGADRPAAVALGRRSSAGSRSASCRRSLTPVRARSPRYRSAAPFVLAIVALLYLSRTARRHDLAGDGLSRMAERRHRPRTGLRVRSTSSAGIVVRGAVIAVLLARRALRRARRSSAPTGSRPSRASRSTRSSRSASGSSTAASG